MRRWLVLGTLLTVVILSVAATGCGVIGGPTGTAAATQVTTAESLLANKYGGAWWSDLFGGGKNEAPLVGSVQAIIGADYTNATSGSQKTAALDRLSTARTTVATLRTDGVLSKADANKVLAAITEIETVVNKL
jgi:hypothetical protein